MCIVIGCIYQAWLLLLSVFTTNHHSNIGAPFLCTEGKEGYLKLRPFVIYIVTTVQYEV